MDDARVPPVYERRLPTKEAANYLRAKFGVVIAPTYLNRLRLIGGGPKFNKFGMKVLYPLDELDAWAASRLGSVRTSTADQG